MATIRLIPSKYTLSNTSYLKITNPNSLYSNTDSTTYATIQNAQNGTTSYYIYIGGFNFGDIPSNAIINSFTVKLKANESGGSTSTSYRPVLCNNTTAITGNSDVINTTVKTITFTGVTASWDTIKGYGSNFNIRINCRRNNRNTTANFYVYGAEILVDYSIPVYYDITTSSENCTISPIGTNSILEGESYSIKINASEKPIVTDNGVDVSNLLTEKHGGLEFNVEKAQDSTYEFIMNANGYYESNNKGISSSTALSIVRFDLPVESTVIFKVINYAESGYDFGLLSNIDKTLSTNASADSSNVFWNGSNKNSASEQIVTYTIPSGEHFVYVKYFKDSYTNSNNDTLQFKVEISPNEEIIGNVYWEYLIDNVQSNHTIIAIYKESDKNFYIKRNDAWIKVDKVYKKINGSWILQSNDDIESVKEYLKANHVIVKDVNILVLNIENEITSNIENKSFSK